MITIDTIYRRFIFELILILRNRLKYYPNNGRKSLNGKLMNLHETKCEFNHFCETIFAITAVLSLARSPNFRCNVDFCVLILFQPTLE